SAERRRLNTVASSSDTLLRVINDVLDLSKAESNQMVLEASRSICVACWTT
ncbi:integral membrane sensor hybrid histidine kinase domain protein, partial [Burkholderia cepacia]|nr:integral membrane sensor hybrid histidine kinase domain protein [Burkholderia cepacia]